MKPLSHCNRLQQKWFRGVCFKIKYFRRGLAWLNLNDNAELSVCVYVWWWMSSPLHQPAPAKHFREMHHKRLLQCQCHVFWGGVKISETPTHKWKLYMHSCSFLTSSAFVVPLKMSCLSSSLNFARIMVNSVSGFGFLCCLVYMESIGSQTPWTSRVTRRKMYTFFYVCIVLNKTIKPLLAI